ncbi:MAG: hypothetical protein ACOY5B_06435 [Spirochaetota bacterium]
MLPGFPELKVAVENGRYICRHGEESLTFYSERSGARDLQQVTALLAGAGSSIPLIVAPYSTAFAPLFTSGSRFFFFAPASFSDSLPNDERLVADAEALQRFINTVDTEDNFVLQILPQWQQLGPVMVQATRDVLARAAVRLKTIRHFGRLWPINFRLNLPLLRDIPDIRQLKVAPDTLILAGPSLYPLPRIDPERCTWCADTALPVLLHHGIRPSVIFTLDAGFASQEHFCGSGHLVRSGHSALVVDALCSPPVLRLPFERKYTYASSHPLVQELRDTLRPDLTNISNPEGNVGNLMLAVCAELFPGAAPLILGHDRGHRNYVTHARGTAYYRRSFAGCSRLANMESYAYRLSQRYGAAPLASGETR